MKLNCPACGAEVAFKSKFSVFGTCSYCSSMLVRHDMDVENIGKQSALPDDFSPLQLGSRGRYEGSAFELVGRLKVSWEDGTWNEWYAAFDDGRDGWISDAQGEFAVSFQVRDAKDLPPARSLRAGERLKLMDTYFDIEDVRSVTCVGSEGELPFRGAAGRKSTSVDLSTKDRFATLDYSDDGVVVYAGAMAEFEELSLTNLREFDGW